MQVLACRWLGTAAMEPTLLAKMSDVMRKDVEKAVAEAPGRPEPQVVDCDMFSCCRSKNLTHF